MKAKLEKLLPEAQVTDYRETNPALTQGLDRATSLLSLMSLVALVLGAVGVAMAMRAHLQQRLDTIAIMKSLGAQQRADHEDLPAADAAAGAAGGIAGCGIFGVGVQLAFPVVLGKLINVQTDVPYPAARDAMVGLGAGVLTTLLFTLPPLLDIRGVRPILILRRAVEDAGVSDDWCCRSWVVLALIVACQEDRARTIAQIACWTVPDRRLGGLAAIAMTLSDSVVILSDGGDREMVLSRDWWLWGCWCCSRHRQGSCCSG